MSAWSFLLIAAIFEVAFAVSMKLSDGFSRLWPTLVTILGVIGGITFLTLALKTLPVSIAYPAWTAIGALGTVIIGTIFLGDAITWLKAASVAAIVIGVMGLRASS